jgi:microcompartment protein CcmL/EutN
VNEALGIVEVQSIARGIVVSDAIAKKAPVQILQSHPISPGKHLVILAGGVAEVEESMAAGIAVAGATLVDRLLLPQAHPQLAPMVAGGATSLGAHAPPPGGLVDSVAIVETYSVCGAVIAADAACKAADVSLVDMRLGVGLGGKAFFTLSGPLWAVEAAVAAGQGVIDQGLLVGVEIIAAPHEDLRRRLMW